MQITAAEFKSDLSKYLGLVSREEIRITENGVDIAVLLPPKSNRVWVDDLIGVISDKNIDERKIKAERLAVKHESAD